MGTPFLTNLFEYTLQVLSSMKIEIAERLVQHHNLRLLGDVVGDHGFLLLAATQRADGLMGQVLDADQSYGPLGGIVVGFVGTVHQPQTAKASHHHHLLYGEGREGIEIEILYDIAHLLSHLVGQSERHPGRRLLRCRA